MCALKLQKKRFGIFFFSSLKQKHQSVWGRTVQTSVKQRWVCSALRIWTRRGDKLSLLPSFETTHQYFIVFFFLYVCDRTQTRFQTHPSHPTGCNLNVAAEKKASGAVEPLGLEPDCRVRQHTTATHFLRHSSLMSGFLRNVQEDAEKWGWFAVGVVCGAAAT